MKTYFVRLADGSIGRTTTLRSVARDNGFLDNCTEEEIVYLGGKQYLASEVTQNPDYLNINKGEKLSELRSKFNTKKITATATSSLGFEIDAGNQAFIDMLGTWWQMWRKNIDTAVFTDANNQTHEVTFAQVETIVDEIITNGKRLYGTKWQLRDEINSSETKEELDNIEIGE